MHSIHLLTLKGPSEADSCTPGGPLIHLWVPWKFCIKGLNLLHAGFPIICQSFWYCGRHPCRFPFPYYPVPNISTLRCKTCPSWVGTLIDSTYGALSLQFLPIWGLPFPKSPLSSLYKSPWGFSLPCKGPLPVWRYHLVQLKVGLSLSYFMLPVNISILDFLSSYYNSHMLWGALVTRELLMIIIGRPQYYLPWYARCVSRARGGLHVGQGVGWNSVPGVHL